MASTELSPTTNSAHSADSAHQDGADRSDRADSSDRSYQDPIQHALDVLSSMASADEVEEIEALRLRAQLRRLRVLIAGEAKRGKSTLVNQLLGQDVLPTGRVPVTAIATTVRRHADRSTADHPVRVSFLDGRVAPFALAALPGLVTEAGNPRNAKGIRTVDIDLGPGPLDDVDVELVDTPGTGTIFSHNTAAAHTAYQGLDAAVFVVTADPPMSASERDLLAQIADRSVHTIVFVNKADQLEAGELVETVEFTRQVCAAATRAAIPIYAGAARSGPADPGFAEFATDFHGYLVDRATADARIALGAHLRRVATTLLDADRIGLRGLDLFETDADDRIRTFGDELDEILHRHAELDDRGWAAARSLRRALDASAAALRDDLTVRCISAVDAALETVENAPSVDDLERRGRAEAARVITGAVDSWRADQADQLERGLGELAGRLAADSAHQLTALREAARSLLDIELQAKGPTQLLTASRGFWYMFDRPASIQLPFTTTVQHWAPNRARRTRTRLLNELPGLVDQQIGRARSDLQQRLQEGVRNLLAQVHRAHEQVLGRIRSAVDDAQAAHRTGLPALRARRSELDARIGRLTELLVSLS